MLRQPRAKLIPIMEANCRPTMMMIVTGWEDVACGAIAYVSSMKFPAIGGSFAAASTRSSLPVAGDGKIVGVVSRYGFSGNGMDRLDEKTGLWERI